MSVKNHHQFFFTLNTNCNYSSFSCFLRSLLPRGKEHKSTHTCKCSNSPFYLTLTNKDEDREQGTLLHFEESPACRVAVFHLPEKVTYSQLGSLPGHHNPMICSWCEHHSATAQGWCYQKVKMVISRSETVTQIKQRAIPVWHLWPKRCRRREGGEAMGCSQDLSTMSRPQPPICKWRKSPTLRTSEGIQLLVSPLPPRAIIKIKQNT